VVAVVIGVMVRVYWWNAGVWDEVVSEDEAPALIARLRGHGHYVWSRPAAIAA
jgi:hypothetical protein